MTIIEDTVTLVIPVYNEEKSIGKVITEWSEYLKNHHISYYLLVVNDGSTDKTLDILESHQKEYPNLIIHTQRNSGHGLAVRFGYQMAIKQKTQYIFQVDSDDQFSPEDFLSFWERREESFALFGYRKKRHDPLNRKIISRFMKYIISGIFDVHIPDANVPYRLFNTQYLDTILSVVPVGNFAPNIFLSIVSFCHLKKPVVIPVQHFSRQGSQAKLLSWRLLYACFKTFHDLLVFSYSLEFKISYITTSLQRKEVLRNKDPIVTQNAA